MKVKGGGSLVYVDNEDWRDWGPDGKGELQKQRRGCKIWDWQKQDMNTTAAIRVGGANKIKISFLIFSLRSRSFVA